MNPISVLILVLIVVAAIFVITYVAHDRGSSMCSGAMVIVQTVAKSRKRNRKKSSLVQRRDNALRYSLSQGNFLF